MLPEKWTPRDTERYLSGIFDAELNLYLQKELVLRMENTHARLAVPKNIAQPKKQKKERGLVDDMLATGFICAIIGAIIGGIVLLADAGGFFSAIFGLILGAVIGAFAGFFGGGLLIGPIAHVILVKADAEEAEEKYQKALEKHQADTAKDAKRVQNEKKRKDLLSQEIQKTWEHIRHCEDNLRELYDFHILHPDYQNIYAVSSILGFFRSGRTQSLAFEPTTGDRGAYNLYEEERRLNLIVLGIQEVLNRLDEIAERQRELANGLRRANERITLLCGSVSTHIKQIEGSAARCEALANLQLDELRKERDLIEWMYITQ